MSEFVIASIVALWIFALVLAFLLAGTLRQLGLMSLRLGSDPGALITRRGLDRGSVGPNTILMDVATGQPVPLLDSAQHAHVLVFTSPGCAACADLMPHLREVAATRRGYAFTVICRGSIDTCRAHADATSGAVRVLADEDGLAESAYDVSLTPFVYLLDYERRVLLRGVVNHWQQMEMLIDQEGVLEGPSTHFAEVS